MSKIDFDRIQDELDVEQVLLDIPVISGTIGRFHILSASFHNIVASIDTITGSLATISRGVFDELTGTNIVGNNLIENSIEVKYLTVDGGMAPALFNTGIDTNGSNIQLDAGSIYGAYLSFNSGTIQTLYVTNLVIENPRRAFSFFAG